MFTGLVEALGTVVSLDAGKGQSRLALAIPFASELALGDSVAVNGCCLTVAAIDSGGKTTQAVMEVRADYRDYLGPFDTKVDPMTATLR